MSSTDSTTIGVHRALHEALNSAREARHRLEDGDATPDLDDLVELGKLLAALSESVMAVNSEMTAKARLAQDVRTLRTGSLAPRPAPCHATAVRAAGCPMRSCIHDKTTATGFRSRQAIGTTARINTPVRANAAG